MYLFLLVVVAILRIATNKSKMDIKVKLGTTQ